MRAASGWMSSVRSQRFRMIRVACVLRTPIRCHSSLSRRAPRSDGTSEVETMNASSAISTAVEFASPMTDPMSTMTTS